MPENDKSKERDIFQRVDVTSTTKNSITIGWKLRRGGEGEGGEGPDGFVLRGYSVKYHAVGSNIKENVQSLGPSPVTYVIKQLHENTVYEICLKAVTTTDRGSSGVTGVLHKSSGVDRSSSFEGNDHFPAGEARVVSTSSVGTPSVHNLAPDGAKGRGPGWDETCIVSSTASSSLSLALGSTLGAFLALGVIVFFVLVAKWQHKNRRRRLKKRWIAAGNMSSTERSHRFDREFVDMDDLSDVPRPWTSERTEANDSHGREHLADDETRAKEPDAESEPEVIPDDQIGQGEAELRTKRNKEAIDALRRLLQDENICAESFVISTPSIKDGSESYNLLVPLSSAQSLLPYLVDRDDQEFQSRHQQQQQQQQKSAGGNCRAVESVRKLKFKKHFTVDYSGCSKETFREQIPPREPQDDHALQQMRLSNCSFAVKQARLFKLQTLKTADCDSSVDVDDDDDVWDDDDECNNEVSLANDEDFARGKNHVGLEEVEVTNSMQQHHEPKDLHGDTDIVELDAGILSRSFSVEW